MFPLRPVFLIVGCDFLPYFFKIFIRQDNQILLLSLLKTSNQTVPLFAYNPTFRKGFFIVYRIIIL